LLSETLTRGTGCLNWARPGLWGLRAGNCPVLPGNNYKNHWWVKNGINDVAVEPCRILYDKKSLYISRLCI